TLKRFLAPLWVFILGMGASLRSVGRAALGGGAVLGLLGTCLVRRGVGLGSGLGLGGRGLRALVWCQHHRHVPAVDAGVGLHPADVAHRLFDLVEDLLAELGVVHLAAPEGQGDLHLVALGQELLDLAGLGVEVAAADLGAVLHLLDADVARLAAGLLGLLRRLVLVLAIVHDTAHG